MVEVVGIFILVQAVRYAFGNWDAVVIGLSLLAVTSVLFIAAFLVARSKDKQNRKTPSGKEYTRVIS